jgi:hypothetical protein
VDYVILFSNAGATRKAASMLRFDGREAARKGMAITQGKWRFPTDFPAFMTR